MNEIDRNRPKSDSHRGIILDAFEARKPYGQMLAEHNLTPLQARCAIGGLLRGGYLSPPATRDGLYAWVYDVAGIGVNSATDAKRLKFSGMRGGVSAQMLPLIKRGFPLDEIWAVEGWKISQMHNALNSLRRGTKMIAKPTQQETNRTRAQTKHIRRILGGEEQLTAEEQNSFALAGEFLKANLLPLKLNVWAELNQLYALHHKSMPLLYADRARLEVFLAARIQIARERRDTSLLQMYRDMGNRVDAKWFDKYLCDEEEFILISLEDEKYRHADNLGFYWQDPYGDKWRPVDIKDGRLVIVGLQELRHRRHSREQQNSRGKSG